jgi:hypothetical protein
METKNKTRNNKDHSIMLLGVIDSGLFSAIPKNRDKTEKRWTFNSILANLRKNFYFNFLNAKFV